MEFGADVNAYTSFDQTVYQLTVPTDDGKALAQGVDILRDWAGNISFDPTEVDKERGVVLEEWRLGRGASARIEDKQLEQKSGDLQNPDHERPRITVPVPHDQPTAVTVATDPELPATQVAIYDKLDHRSEATKGDYRRFLVEGLYHQMLGARFSELAEEPDAPFLFAGSQTGSLVRASDLFTRQAEAKEGTAREALAAVIKEIVRVD